MVLMLAGAACTDSEEKDAAIDVIGTLDGHTDLAGWTVELLGAEPPSEAAERAAAAGGRIAATVAAFDSMPTFESTIGATSQHQVGVIGGFLGGTAGTFDELAADGDGVATRTALEYALALAWSASAQPSFDPDERMRWVLPADVDADIRDEVEHALLNDEVAAAARTVHERTDVHAADVVATVAGELGEVVPVGNGGDLLTSLNTAYNLGELSVG